MATPLKELTPPTNQMSLPTFPRNLLIRDPQNDEIDLIVGSEEYTTISSKHALCTTSTFFKKIFASKPLTCKTIILPDEEPKYVNAFNIWLINKCLIVTVTVTELMSLYLLADRFSCNFFKNYIMDLLQDHLLSKDLLLKAEEITRIWKETKSTAKTPIRKFCVALMSFEVFRGTGLVEEVMMLHEENKGLIEEYIRWQMEMKDIRTKTTDDPRVRGRFGESGFRICTFHAHEAGDDECDSVANTYMVKKGKLDF